MDKFLLLFLNLYLLLGCTSKNNTTDLTKDIKYTEISSASVGFVEIKEQKFYKEIESVGLVEPHNEYIFFSPVDSRLFELNVENGDFIEKNQVLGRLDSSEIIVKKYKLEYTLFASKKEYESKLLTYKNLLSNLKEDEISDIKKKLKLDVGLLQSEVELESVLKDLKSCIIGSPMSGRLVNLKVKKNEFVKKGQELFSIYDPTSIVLKAHILESNVSNVKIGCRVSISFFTGIGNMNGVVSAINPIIDKNGLMQVSIKVVNANNLDLLPGMHLKCIFPINLQNGIVIPKEAIVFRNNRSIVFTIKNGYAKWNDVNVVSDNGKNVLVSGSIRIGDSVITSNNLQLVHDSPIQIGKRFIER